MIGHELLHRQKNQESKNRNSSFDRRVWGKFELTQDVIDQKSGHPTQDSSYYLMYIKDLSSMEDLENTTRRIFFRPHSVLNRSEYCIQIT